MSTRKRKKGRGGTRNKGQDPNEKPDAFFSRIFKDKPQLYEEEPNPGDWEKKNGRPIFNYVDHLISVKTYHQLLGPKSLHEHGALRDAKRRKGGGTTSRKNNRRGHMKR
jgi:hypothetical protein